MVESKSKTFYQISKTVRDVRRIRVRILQEEESPQWVPLL